jgi:hypothetical protein
MFHLNKRFQLSILFLSISVSLWFRSTGAELIGLNQLSQRKRFTSLQDENLSQKGDETDRGNNHINSDDRKKDGSHHKDSGHSDEHRRKGDNNKADHNRDNHHRNSHRHGDYSFPTMTPTMVPTFYSPSPHKVYMPQTSSPTLKAGI